jgi:DMSO/TMAO reductase YedYZ molybdopterin-dependent catalytic subunit
MWTRRRFLKRWLGAFVAGMILHPPLERFIRDCWAQAKKLLPRGFPRDRIIQMNPAEVDNRDLEIDPLEKFGTMGTTDRQIDLKTYRLKVSGEVDNPLSLSFDQILQLPSVTEVVLLICPGFFANNGRWTGISFQTLLQRVQPKKEAKFVNIKGAEKVTRIPIKESYEKGVFLAYQVNGEALPRKHGFPLRLVLEDHYGSDWVKYVNEIEVS